MTEPKLYTTAEVEELLKQHTERLESAHFEEQTKEVLAHINKRLDESNNYKNTIGKDLRDVKVQLEAMRINAEAAAKKIKEDLAEQEKKDDKRYMWHQDRWVRAGIAAAIIWEIWTIFDAPLTKLAHVVWGL